MCLCFTSTAFNEYVSGWSRQLWPCFGSPCLQWWTLFFKWPYKIPRWTLSLLSTAHAFWNLPNPASLHQPVLLILVTWGPHSSAHIPSQLHLLTHLHLILFLVFNVNKRFTFLLTRLSLFILCISSDCIKMLNVFNYLLCSFTWSFIWFTKKLSSQKQGYLVLWAVAPFQVKHMI